MKIIYGWFSRCHLVLQVGTLLYIAPEIVRGDWYDERCDVYSFAVVLLAMLELRENVITLFREEVRLYLCHRCHHPALTLVSQPHPRNQTSRMLPVCLYRVVVEYLYSLPRTIGWHLLTLVSPLRVRVGLD